jgi:hypothetical protein
MRNSPTNELTVGDPFGKALVERVFQPRGKLQVGAPQAQTEQEFALPAQPLGTVDNITVGFHERRTLATEFQFCSGPVQCIHRLQSSPLSPDNGGSSDRSTASRITSA